MREAVDWMMLGIARQVVAGLQSGEVTTTTGRIVAAPGLGPRVN